MATKNFNRDFFNAILSNVDAMTLPAGMTANEMRECFTCSDLMAEGLFPADKQSQYASRICNNLVNEGNAEKGTLKGKTVFMAVGTFDTIEGIKPYKVSK